MSRLIIDAGSARTSRGTRGRLRLAAAAAASIALVACASPASAATNTITFAPIATLTAKVAISVPITIVCDPLPDAGTASNFRVQIKQANGKQISSASGELWAYPGGQNMLVCDGSTQNNVVVQAMPDTGSGPFKNGTAYATASFTYQAGTWPGITESGSTSGAIKLR